jgi:tol-pal system protein YbgF
VVYRPNAVPALARSAPAVALWLGLCACGAAAPRHPDAKVTAANDVVARLERESLAQATRVAELEARIALLEADARQLRDAAASPKRSTETVRISAAHRREQEARTDDEVPLVRLHEAESDPEATARIDMPLVLPQRPAGVEARLPVVPLPEQRAGKLLTAGATASSADADARERYRVALRTLRERRFEQAGAQLAAFLDAHPAHALSDGATYWLGEVRYAQRRYADALQQFEAVLQVFPASSKRAGALLKAGLCKKHLGDESSARSYFEQLREQFPNSDAARIASREGSS